MSEIGHNGIAGGQLRSLIQRIERLEEEKATLSADIREVYSEAKGTGFDPKVMRQIVRERKQDEINNLVRHARQRCGARLVPATTGGVRSMLLALRAGEVVSLLPDQVPPDSCGEFAPFFGEPAYTMTLATNLIQRTGAKAIYAVCKRVGGGKYEINYQPADEDIYSSDSATALGGLNKSIERCVLDCPEQYQWAYKRYKKMPNRDNREY